MTRSDRDVTALLRDWGDGNREALDELMPLVFDDLHSMARSFFQRESDTHTLQATALVSELFLILENRPKTAWQSRKKFFAFASEVMRTFLVDYARARKSQKRGGAVPHEALEEISQVLGATPDPLVFLDLDRALEALSSIDPQQARIVELRWLLGLQVDEVAEVLELSEATIKRKWASAKIWLLRRLTADRKLPALATKT